MTRPVVFEITPVKCYSGSKGDEIPKSFKYIDKTIDVYDIFDRWYEGGQTPTQSIYNYFKIKTIDGQIFLLRHNVNRGSWSVKIADV